MGLLTPALSGEYQLPTTLSQLSTKSTPLQSLRGLRWRTAKPRVEGHAQLGKLGLRRFDLCSADRTILSVVQKDQNRLGAGSHGVKFSRAIDDLVQRVQRLGHLLKRGAESLEDLVRGPFQLIVAKDRGRGGGGVGMDFP